MKKLWLVLTCTLLLAALALAHGGMEHILGTVTEVTDHSISLKTRAGTQATVEFNSETKFFKGDAPATAKDVQVGNRVAIHAQQSNKALRATEVRIGSDAPPGAR